MTARALIALALVAACGGPTVSQPDAGPDAEVFDAPPELDAPLALDAPWIDAPPGVDAGPVACTAPPAAPGASAVVGPAGGTLAVGAARLVIPAGALAAATTVTLRPVAIDLPSSQRALTAAYEVGPAGLAFAAPATLTFQLAATLPAIDDVTVRQGLAAGPFASVVTTRNGSAYTAAVPGATVAFAARVTAAAPATSTCAPTAQPADDAYLFENVAASGNYFTSYARATNTGFAVAATHQAGSLWNLFGYGYAPTGAATGTINYTSNVVAAIFGGHVVPAGSDVLIAYDSNLTMGSEVWVAKKSAAGAAVGAPVRVSQDPAVYSVEPQLVALPGGGAFVVWRAFDQPPGAYLRAAVLDASLAVVDRFDLTPPIAASAPGSFALVASAAGVGVAWQWASNTGNGVRYQGFTLAGCPATEVIEVGPSTISPETVSATLVGDQVVIASAGNTALGASRVLRVRTVGLTTGLLGPSRRYDDVALTHPGITAHDGGFQVAGASGLGIKHVWLDADLDRRSAPATIGTTSAIYQPLSIATSTSGDAALVTWVDQIGGGTARGHVRVVACTP